MSDLGRVLFNRWLVGMMVMGDRPPVKAEHGNEHTEGMQQRRRFTMVVEACSVPWARFFPMTS